MRPTEYQTKESRHYYGELFSSHPLWSTPDPNCDEWARFEIIEKYLKKILSEPGPKPDDKIRILDVGCGRGWLTSLANQYGAADVVDPVPESIQTARKMHPDLNFMVGTASDVSRAHGQHRYHVVISSEVIEHVVDKKGFVEEITSCLRTDGHVIITTPRGELYENWLKAETLKQPVEQWITEKEAAHLFESGNYDSKFHDRIYQDIPGISLIHRICASRRFKLWSTRLKIGFVHEKLKHRAAIYQAWCFKYNGSHNGS
jgi:2-polyprenyl-3-methyl-5-hydroxy-6-metoxy-1,4-benzoquinol methylase